MTALKAIDAVLRRDETKDYGSRGKVILISGGYGVGKSMLAERMLGKIRVFSKQARGINSKSRSISFFNATATQGDRFIPMIVFRNVFIDMIGDYVDRVRFQDMENDEGEI